MTQPSFSGGTAVAEPPVLPAYDEGETAPDNRKKLLMVGAPVGVVILAAGWFFLHSGGGATDNQSFVPHGHPAPAAAAKAPAPVKLPKTVKAPEGRDPFKALYTAPVAAAAGGTGTTTSTTSGGTTGSTTPTSTSTGTATTPVTTTSGSGTTTGTTATYHPVWLRLTGLTSTTASFQVGYSNGKALKAKSYRFVKAPKTGSETVFATNFSLLGERNGTVLVKFGDGSPIQLDLQHNFMVVD